jgi:spermidine/putrescine transport system substrate-binding protein
MKKKKRMSRRGFLKGAAGVGAALIGGFPNILRASTKEVVVYAWYTPVMNKLLPIFEKETGIRVKNLGGYSKDAEWFAKLRSGENIDFIIPGSNYAITAIKADMFKPLDLNRLPNYKNLGSAQHMPEFMKDGKDYAVPWARVIYPIFYNTDYIKETPRSWKDCWNPKYKGKVSMNDRAQLMIATAAIILGDNPNDPQKWDEIRKVLVEQKALVVKYWTDHQAALEMFSRGDAWIGIHSDGRIRSIMQKGAHVNYSIPNEGALYVLDNLAIPATSKNPEAAHELVNFCLKVESALEEMTTLWYLAANEAAVKRLPDNLRPMFELPKNAKLILLQAPSPELNAKIEKLWLEVKMG